LAAPANGTVVLVRFPFSDLSASKLRPALVLAQAGRGDTILCQITSRSYADERAIEISTVDLASGTLVRNSYARPAKLFTGNESIIQRDLGTLHVEKFDEILVAVRGLFSPNP
jgi:mRNA interferase MazF